MAIRWAVPLVLVVSAAVPGGRGDGERLGPVEVDRGLVPVIRLWVRPPREAGASSRVVVEKIVPDGKDEVIHRSSFFGNEAHFEGRARTETRAATTVMAHDIDGLFSECIAPSKCVKLSVHRELPTSARRFARHHAVHCGIRIGGTYLLCVGPRGELRLIIEKPGRPYGDYLARR